ncbi:MAG TPA: PEP-CTERM sorting domain-containing protein [Opitutus sp.]|nr:PEP-CTERM sorting domain-containing protein [Opitutus sp.]
MCGAKRFFLLILALSAALRLRAQVTVSFYSDGGDGFTHDGFVLSSERGPLDGSYAQATATFKSYYMPSEPAGPPPTWSDQPYNLPASVTVSQSPLYSDGTQLVLVILDLAEGGGAPGYNPNPGQNPWDSGLYARLNPNNQARLVISGFHPADPTKRYDSVQLTNASWADAALTLDGSIDPITGDITITVTDWKDATAPDDNFYFGWNAIVYGTFTLADVAAVPEPAVAALVLAMAAGAAVWWRRRRAG